MGTAHIQESSLTAIANAIRSKNGTSTTYTPTQMASAISALPSGTTVVSKYNVTIDALLGDANGSDVLQQPTGADTDIVFTGIEDVATYALHYKFSRNLKIRSVSFPDLTNITTAYALYYMCYYASNVASISFPVLESITGSNAMGNAFYYCTALTSASFPELTTVTGTSAMSYLFSSCSNLETVSFPKLKTIGPSSSTSTNNRHFYQAFNNCNKLESVTFPALETVYCNGNGTSYGTFASNNKVKKFYFPKLTTMTYTSNYTNANKAQPLENMFTSCSALTEIHFALTNKTAVEAMVGYSTAWGAPSGCQILFDL